MKTPLVFLVARVVASAAADSSQSGGSDAADRRAAAALLEQRLAANSAEIRKKKEDAVATLLAAREKVHEDHMRRHRMVDPDEHAVLTDDIRRKFLISRRNLLIEQTPQSFMQTALLIAIFVLPLVIIVVWLRS